MRAILLTGVNGQVGWELRRALAPLGRVFAVGSRELDLADIDATRHLIRELRPNIIVNPAAYTAVDKAESEPGLAHTINGIAPGVLAEEAKRLGALFVHYSTDYVFDGESDGEYGEDHATNPNNVYGKTKLEGELAIGAANPDHLIFRTSWVYGARGKNFLRTMLRLGSERDSLKVVNDQIGAPTWSRLIAESTALAIARFKPDLSGTYHLTNTGKTSWHGFASAIVDGYAARLESAGWPVLKLTSEAIAAIGSDQYPTPAKRPTNSALNTSRFCNIFSLELPDWHDSLDLVLDDLACAYADSRP